MSSCCSGEPSSSVQNCPQCDISCKNISMKTILHHVRFPEILKIEEDHYYCSGKNCPVGYFTQAGNTIPKAHLRVFDEHQSNKLCYCFDISTERYKQALKDNTADKIKQFVTQKTKSGDCACEIRNPSGQCCLASFKQLEKKSEYCHG